jgi:aminoglycoside phosphotransferase (APT) family kinase protein
MFVRGADLRKRERHRYSLSPRSERPPQYWPAKHQEIDVETTRVPLEVAEVSRNLARFMTATCGPGCSVEDVRVMEAGHAGLTFGFDLVGPTPQRRRGLVLKLAPPGVRRSGNTDVYKQAPLLRALAAAGLPAPDVPFADAGEEWFGTPFVIMERLRGLPFFVWTPDRAFDRSPAAVAPLYEQVIDAMAAVHRFDWRRHLADWEAPRALADEVLRWDPILAKSPRDDWIESGRVLRDLLLATRPDGAPIGLVHGDCQPGNALFDGGRLTGLIDWELASIGSCRIDAGWMMMLADRASWPDAWRPCCPLAPAQVAARYEQAIGERCTGLAWYQAYAGYRLGAIACLNVHLHRSGRRRDAVWENLALAIAPMFGRATAIAEQLRVPSGAGR